MILSPECAREQRYRYQLPRHQWIRRLQVGDIVRAKSGLLRVVRAVTHHPHGVSSIVFVIKHCSWTRRCYTYMNSHDLITFGYRPTGKRLPLRKNIDKEIASNIVNHSKDLQTLKCCDVEGLS